VNNLAAARIWFALLAVPVLALVDQAVSYATTIWACSHQNAFAVHAVHVVFLLVALGGALGAWQAWRRTASVPAQNETLARRRFVAGLATGAASLSVLVIAAMWGVSWVMRACMY
jgi:hypothetical protein